MMAEPKPSHEEVSPVGSLHEDVFNDAHEHNGHWGEKKAEFEPTMAGGAATAAAVKSNGGIEHVERVVPKRTLTRKQKIINHYKRFWLWYLIGGIIFLAIFLPLLFLKIVPAIAQAIVDKTALPIYSAKLQALNNSAVMVGLHSSLSIPSGLTVELDPITMYFYNAWDPSQSIWTAATIPETVVQGTTDINIEGDTVFVQNYTALNSWLNQTFYGDTTQLAVFGNTTAHLGALKAHINLNKVVEIAGLRALEGVSINNMELKLPAESDGTNLVGNVTLPNWSILQMGLGNLTLNAWSGSSNVLIGNLTVNDVNLVPGNNTIPFRGQIFIDALISNLVTIFSSQASTLLKGNLLVGISGNKTLIDGEHITYLEDILNPAKIYSEVPIGQILSYILQSAEDGSLSLSGIISSLVGGGGLSSVISLIEQLLGGGGGNSTGNSTGLLGTLGGLLGGLNLTQLETRDMLTRSLDVLKAKRDLEETLSHLSFNK